MPLPFYTNVPEEINSSFVFFPITDVPDKVKKYIPNLTCSLEEQCGLMITDSIDYILHDNTNNRYKGAVFLDYLHKINYYANGISVWTNSPSSSRLFLNFPNSDTKSDNSPMCRNNMHVMSWRVFDSGSGKYYQYLVVYFSEVYPDVFDFDSEFERSKFS